MIRHIAALDSQRGIGRNGAIPWHLPDELRHFKDMTVSSGGMVLMGRITYEVIGHALPGRRNVVVTRQVDYKPPAVTIAHDLDVFLGTISEDIWIIGGASIFEQTLAVTDELYLTEIDADFGCDQYYPEFHDAFELSQNSELQSENGIRYVYKTYRRR